MSGDVLRLVNRAKAYLRGRERETGGYGKRIDGKDNEVPRSSILPQFVVELIEVYREKAETNSADQM